MDITVGLFLIVVGALALGFSGYMSDLAIKSWKNIAFLPRMTKVHFQIPYIIVGILAIILGALCVFGVVTFNQ
jgi:hypothetical protein